MTIVWRGIGIVVPILTFTIAWILSYWYEDTTMGNTSYSGLILILTGSILIPIGIFTWKGKEVKDVGQHYIKKHDFFFIPLLIWGIIFLGLGIYLKAL